MIPRSCAQATRKLRNSRPEDQDDDQDDLILCRYREYLEKEICICGHLTRVLNEIEDDDEGDLVSIHFSANVLAGEMAILARSFEQVG